MPALPKAEAYARAHRKFLEESKPELYRSLKASGELEEHVRTRGEEAAAMAEDLQAQMSAQSGPPGESFPERVARFEQIPLIANEMVMTELVFSA